MNLEAKSFMTLGVGGKCREFLNHECSMARTEGIRKGVWDSSQSVTRGLTIFKFFSRIGLFPLKIGYKALYNTSRHFKCLRKGYRVNYIKAHLDGAGRGEWGEAHILAHKAKLYVCVRHIFSHI
jgi:hypothetical protein